MQHPPSIGTSNSRKRNFRRNCTEHDAAKQRMYNSLPRVVVHEVNTRNLLIHTDLYWIASLKAAFRELRQE
jgi:hypothetical protein